ncbi:MAG: LamG-like jellyroll fold domain-containing protein, partial [Candidatus Kariarchaeaceae archaeon]
IVDSSLKNGKLKADASDLLFITNGTKLAHEIERFTQNSTHGELTAWVKIPELLSSEDTIISMYFGNSEIFDQENPLVVWDSNYMGVWHLSDDPTGTIYDSTINDNDGSSGGSMTPSDKVLAKIGEGIDFDGSNDYIAFPDPLSTETMTISCWVYLDAASADWITVAMRSDGISWFDWQFYARASDAEQANHAVFRTVYPGSSEVDSDVILSTGAWYYLVGEHNGTHNQFFTNGSVSDTDTESGSVGDSSSDVWIGGNEIWGEYLNGRLDEFRVSNIARSSDWIATQYNNQKDTSDFYSIGTTSISPEIEGSSYGFVWLDTPDEVDLGTTYNSWVTQDLSDDSVPATATGVLLAWSEADAGDTSAVARGIEDTNDYMDGGSIYNEFEDKTWKMQVVKLDSENQIETFREEVEDTLYVMGYTMGHDPWFRPNPSDLGSLTADSSWHTITVEGVDDDTTGVILFGQSLFVNDSIIAVRSVGSTDDLTTAEWEEYHSAMIFVKIDENDQFQYYLSNAAKFYVVAEVKNSVDWLTTNRVDISPTSGGWTTIDLDSYITVNSLTSGVIYQFVSTDSSEII